MSASSENGSSHSINLTDSSPNGIDVDVDVDVAVAHDARDGLVCDNSGVPKPKRLACMICRKRKLKCDGTRPSCSTCSRLGHCCTYDEQRRKSGPKRGYVKALEERLKQVETLLKTQEPPSTKSPQRGVGASMPGARHPNHPNAASNIPTSNPAMATAAGMGMGMGISMAGEDRWAYNGESLRQGTADDFKYNSSANAGINGAPATFTWEMIGLGLEEPLPPQKTIDELHQIYFEKVHQSVPMIHRYRYLAAMNLAPALRPPVCLRYAMWALACSISDKFSNVMDLFYQRARKYIEADYMKGYGEHMVSVAHCQTHILLTIYEMKMMYFPRAWVNTGSAVRLAQMLGLHRLDGAGLEVKQCLPPPKDWTEREERRRTFWMAFCQDRYASIGTGWPMTIHEQDIMTNLPSSEEAFEMNRPEKGQTLEESMSPAGAIRLSSFGGAVLVASLFGRNLNHLHRPDDDELDRDLNSPFWKRHRQMDSILLSTSLSLPPQLRLPGGQNNPNVVFTNMSIHTSTICLHQAAIFRAEKHKISGAVSSESKVRCFTAANEIANIMRAVSHLDLSSMHPFIAFCLYVAARVFIQYLKSKTDDTPTIDSLCFLLSAMDALKRRSPLTESFLVQLDVDFGALAQKIPELKNAFPRSGDQLDENYVRSGGPVCDDPEGVRGILSYRDDCNFTKDPVDAERAATTPEPLPGQSQGDGLGLSSAHSDSYGGQSWLSSERKVPILTPSSGSLYERNTAGGATLGGFADGHADERDASGSPDGRHSAGRTPNSSGDAPDNRSHVVPIGSMGPSAPAIPPHEPFHASPISPQQPAMNGHAGVNGRNHHASFYPATSGYAMTDIPSHHAFTMSSGGWGGMNGHVPGMQPVGEGVLRALMTMGPMDAMDLSSWETNHPR